MTHAPGAVTPLLFAATSNSNGSSTLLIFVVIGAAFYFLIYRPQQKKQKAARAQASAYEVGDEVVTAGGIVGRVLDIDDDRVTLETSVGASFTVLRPYVLRKLEPAEPPQDVVDEQDGHEPEPPPVPGRPPGRHALRTPRPTTALTKRLRRKRVGRRHGQRTDTARPPGHGRRRRNGRERG